MDTLDYLDYFLLFTAFLQISGLYFLVHTFYYREQRKVWIIILTQNEKGLVELLNFALKFIVLEIGLFLILLFHRWFN